jgi:hypothetical protein
MSASPESGGVGTFGNGSFSRTECSQENRSSTGGTQLRLHDIRTVKPGQACRGAGGKEYPYSHNLDGHTLFSSFHANLINLQINLIIILI